MDALRLDGLHANAPAQGVVEVLERDGHEGQDAQVRQSVIVTAWPLRIGRALDNDLVLSDPHVAPQHLRIDAVENGLQLTVGDTRNGVQLGARRLAAGEQHTLPVGGEAIELPLGRTPLRLRLPGQVLADERPLAADVPRRRHGTQLLVATALLLAGLLFNAWLDSDPDGWWRAAASVAVGSVGAAAVWCGLWALLSKTFTRSGRFGWHLRVFVIAGCVLLVVGLVPNLLAYSFSWPAFGDFGFIASYAVAGVAFYFHLLAVEPARPRLMRWVAVAGVLAAVTLNLWQNEQRSDRYGDELYMSHLFPPALRVARPVSTDQFMSGVAALQAGLDKRAKEAASGDGGAGGGEDE